MFAPSHRRFFGASGTGLLIAGSLLVATLGYSGKAGDEPTDRQLARQVMTRWRSELASNASWFQAETNLRKLYSDVWSTIDLDEAIRQDQANPVASIGLLEKLAAAGRWNDVVEVSNRFQGGRYHLYWFWGRVAQYGLDQGDMKIVELAGTQVEANADWKPNFIGGPPSPRREFLAARIFVAAARLELLRGGSGEDNRHRDVLHAADDLWRTAGAFTPRRGPFVVLSDSVSPILQYAALESWGPAGFNPVFLDANQPDPLNTQWKQLHDMVAETKLGWPVRLPRLDNDVVTPWIQRQVHQGRHQVALSFLAQAEGEPADRARLLAIVAADMHTTNPEGAETCRQLAQGLVDRATNPNQNQWLHIAANAEIAIAYQAGGDRETARAITAQALRDFDSLMATSPAKETINYDSIHALVCAAANTGFQRSEVSEDILRHVDRMGYYNVSKEVTPVRVNGIDRVTNLSQLAKPVSPSHPSSTYESLVQQKDWPAAVAEVQRLAKGNSAWKETHPQLGAKSVRDLGFAATLLWTAKIDDVVTRMMVELGAVAEATQSDRKSLPNYRMWNTADTIAPGINGFRSDC